MIRPQSLKTGPPLGLVGIFEGDLRNRRWAIGSSRFSWRRLLRWLPRTWWYHMGGRNRRCVIVGCCRASKFTWMECYGQQNCVLSMWSRFSTTSLWGYSFQTNWVQESTSISYCNPFQSNESVLTRDHGRSVTGWITSTSFCWWGFMTVTRLHDTMIESISSIKKANTQFLLLFPL